MEVLKKKRSTIKGKATRLSNILNAKLENDELDVVEIDIYKEQLTEIWSELNDINNNIMVLCETETETKCNEDEYDEIATKIELLKIKIAKFLKSKDQINCVSYNRDSHISSVKLPRIDLPTFSGYFTEWMSFRDLFVATIHNNSSLSDVQRLQYLKLSLKGTAATLIQAIQITDDNYKKAWKLVCDRFDNESEILAATLDKLFSQPTLSQESSIGLRKLLDTTTQCLDTLEILKQPIEQWDTILVYFLKRKLDSETLRQWTLSLSKGELPTYKHFRSFIENRASALASLNVNKLSTAAAKLTAVKGGESHPRVKEVKPFSSNHYSSSCVCYFCKSNSHSIYKCTKFLDESVAARRQFILKNKLCNNCLKSGHFSNKCLSSKCKECNQLHNTLLHEVESKHVEFNNNDISLSTQCSKLNISNVLLPTAIIKVFDSRGNVHPCRAILDSGSERSFVREACVQQLGLRRQRTKINISGLTSTSVGTANGLVQLIFSSYSDAKLSYTVDALVLSKVTCDLPQNPVDISQFKHFKHLKLADEHYSETGPIDILLGADIFPQLLLSGRLPSSSGSLTALETVFGWIIVGRVDLNKNACSSISTHFVQCDSEFELQKFWELEEVSEVKPLTVEETLCEKHFQATYSRDANGRFVVKLPFKDSQLELCSSRHSAVRRFLQTERRFGHNLQFSNAYKDVMNEYLKLDHMALIPTQSIDKPANSTYYLPHHAVVNPLNPNKFRIVFDGSARTSSGVSLNDLLMVGPRLQDDLASLLVRFRMHRVAMVADIVKMFLQIRLHLEDTDYQRVVWRDSHDQLLKDFRLLTVTFGLSSSPYLAVRCLQQLARDEQNSYPEASAIILKDFYVDDLMTGASSVSEALKLQKDLIQILKNGGFELKKWYSNESTLLESLPIEFRGSSSPLNITNDDSIKTLGILWHPASDTFTFKVDLPTQITFTKRIILSNIARLFDPLGWLSPIVVRCKILMQKVWKLHLTWDEELPPTIANEWHSLYEDMLLVTRIRIPRYMSSFTPSLLELHGFSDASEVAYSAVVYLRTLSNDNNVNVQIMASKTRVSPLKTLSLPRLELCGAVLLSKLVDFIRKALNINSSQVYCWTDSTIVISWISSHSSKWKTFVANRVAKIQHLTIIEHWNHVRSGENPADCASRGIPASMLQSFSLWWNGPDFLHQGHVPVTDIPGSSSKEVNQELRVKEVPSAETYTTVIQQEETFNLLERFSSLTKLLRVTAYCLRFASNARNPLKAINGFLTSQEIENSLQIWIRTVQVIEFKEEINCLAHNKQLSCKNKLLPLNPFLDSKGILRVGGRLRHANIPHDQKHPILLPKRNILTELIIRHYHLSYLHAGPQLLLSLLHQKYWILSARDIVRQHVRKCVTCFRQQAQTAKQMMGDLPAPRIQPARAFLRSGVDYCGPFTLRASKGRGRTIYKGYISVFVCFTTRAVHLELVGDLTTETFIAALKRFISRRGKCSDMFSDCGTNFLGASRKLKDVPNLTQSSKHNDEVSHFLSDQGINWHFNPPSAPHMGGLWEAGVKSVKYHLKRILGNSSLCYEEMNTVLIQIEACLNSRPLCPISADPSDLSVLTPGHFLIGDALTAIPESDYTSSTINRLNRWQLLQRLLQNFWKRWSKEYLTRLQQRPKWLKKTANLKIGDMVIIKEDNLPPMRWRLGRIAELFPGHDQCVRVVTVKTADGLIKRPITKLSQLPIEQP